MILGIMSDTHGNVRLFHPVAGLMKERFGVGVIIHAGDDYVDAEELELAGHEVRKVPGLGCDAYVDGGTPRVIVEAFGGITLACAHDEKDLRATDRAAALIVTGHTHRAALERLGRSIYINPGHLASGRARGGRPSFAIVDIGERQVRAAIHEADGAVRLEQTFERRLLG